MKYGQNVHKHDILEKKQFSGKMGGVYVSYVASVDKKQWHVETLVRSIKSRVHANNYQWQAGFEAN